MESMRWPNLDYQKWKDTLDTLHMWMQIVGKIKLEFAPFLNHWWEVGLYLTPNGITTGAIPYNGELFQIDFDFFEHTLSITTSWNKSKTLRLRSESVATFYKRLFKALKDVGIAVSIWPVPVEIQNPIPFVKDTQHASYDKEHVMRWFTIISNTAIVFEQFRTYFRGKSSPTLFYWGSFDLNGTRFSGKKATPPNMKGVIGKIMQFAENEENFAFGFWPGDKRYPSPAFYTYLYPKPAGMDMIHLEKGASFNEQLDECILPYEVVRNQTHPEKSILDFLQTSYDECAALAKWNVKDLVTEVPPMN